MKRRIKRVFLYACLAVLLAVFGYSLYRYLSIQKDYRNEKKAHEALLQYRPSIPDPGDAVTTSDPVPDSEIPESGTADPNTGLPGPDDFASDPEPTKESVTNASILQLREDYPDSVGWITVPGTDVDYPFVQGKDNSYYLRRGIDGKYLYAGIPFLDYRCPSDFSGSNTIIYGHNLRNGSMFGTLTSFKDSDFFRNHRYFYIFLAHDTIRAEIIACLVITPSQAPYVFEPTISSDFAEKCISDARCSAAGLTFSSSDRFITLATCDYERDNSRVILVGRILN